MRTLFWGGHRDALEGAGPGFALADHQSWDRVSQLYLHSCSLEPSGHLGVAVGASSAAAVPGPEV